MLAEMPSQASSRLTNAYRYIVKGSRTLTNAHRNAFRSFQKANECSQRCSQRLPGGLQSRGFQEASRWLPGGCRRLSVCLLTLFQECLQMLPGGLQMFPEMPSDGSRRLTDDPRYAVRGFKVYKCCKRCLQRLSGGIQLFPQLLSKASSMLTNFPRNAFRRFQEAYKCSQRRFQRRPVC